MKIVENNNDRITKIAKLMSLKSSIFFPIQIITILLISVAIEYIPPNSEWLKFKSCLIYGLKIPMKKVCPKLEQKVIRKPKKRYLKFNFINL